MTEEAEKKERLFPELDGDENQVTELDSLCMYCHCEGRTRLMLTLIPHFKEVVISSFSCDHCGYEDRGIQSGGRIQERGVRYEVRITEEQDLNRQVVRSEWSSLAFPDIDFEQPCSKRGEVNTVEGILSVISHGLATLQPERREQDPETASKIDEFIIKLTRLKLLDDPFTLIVDDPSGNSYVENPSAPEKDPAMTITHYTRTHQQEVSMGLVAEDEETEEDPEDINNENSENVNNENSENVNNENSENVNNESEEKKDFSDEILGFQTNCPECNTPCDTNMKVTDIPFFKQCIIMATTCDACGHRENEVKAGSGIEPKGKMITLKLTDVSDLSRDVLKSDTCTVKIPEMDFELVQGTLGSRFTTVEGLLVNIKDQLTAKNPFIMGDSAEDGTARRLAAFCDKLQKIIDGERLNVHLVLDDPAGNSYIQNVYAPEADPEMEQEEYTRSYEQNEELGLNDMKTENYVAS